MKIAVLVAAICLATATSVEMKEKQVENIQSESKLEKTTAESSQELTNSQPKSDGEVVWKKSISTTSGDTKVAESIEETEYVENYESHKSPDESHHQRYPEPYDFGFALKDSYSGQQFRQERMDDKGAVHGRYGYKDNKGMYRQVDYTADDRGYRANVRTNEPGILAGEDPSSVNIKKSLTGLFHNQGYPADERKPQNSYKEQAYQEPVRGHQEAYPTNKEPPRPNYRENRPQNQYNQQNYPRDVGGVMYSYFRKHLPANQRNNNIRFPPNHQNFPRRPDGYGVPERNNYPSQHRPQERPYQRDERVHKVPSNNNNNNYDHGHIHHQKPRQYKKPKERPQYKEHVTRHPQEQKNDYDQQTNREQSYEVFSHHPPHHADYDNKKLYASEHDRQYEGEYTKSHDLQPHHGLVQSDDSYELDYPEKLDLSSVLKHHDNGHDLGVDLHNSYPELDGIYPDKHHLQQVVHHHPHDHQPIHGHKELHDLPLHVKGDGKHHVEDHVVPYDVGHHHAPEKHHLTEDILYGTPVGKHEVPTLAKDVPTYIPYGHRTNQHQLIPTALQNGHEAFLDLPYHKPQQILELHKQHAGGHSYSKVPETPNYAILLYPAHVKAVPNFKVSAKNIDHQQWIPIVPQIRYIPLSKPITDWIPMKVPRHH